MHPPFKVLPIAKRTAFDQTGRAVEGVIHVEVAALAGINAGPVKLLNGAEGRGGGFGLAHIEANAGRKKQLASLGFQSIHNYVRHIIEGVTMMALQDDGRIILVREDGAEFHHLICQWDGELNIWSVTTAIPKRHARGLIPFWEK